jgi:hypothetical protein
MGTVDIFLGRIGSMAGTSDTPCGSCRVYTQVLNSGIQEKLIVKFMFVY